MTTTPTPTPLQMPIERISVEVTNQCDKGCWFCYNHSQPSGETRWTADELVAFVSDCAKNGVKAVSFGGGEPLQYPPIFEVLSRLEGELFRSMTTNGLLLEGELLEELLEAAPDKVHLSIHFPHNRAEVSRVIEQVQMLADRGINSGVNLLVRRSNIEAASRAAAMLHAADITNERIVYLPMRGEDTPTPRQLAEVARDARFQSMTCLLQCGRSPRFCSIGWDKSVAWCSYTTSRQTLADPSYDAMTDALDGLGLAFCGGDER